MNARLPDCAGFPIQAWMPATDETGTLQADQSIPLHPSLLLSAARHRRLRSAVCMHVCVYLRMYCYLYYNDIEPSLLLSAARHRRLRSAICMHVCVYLRM